MDVLVPGLTADVTIVVGDADTAIAHGSGDVAVLATPRVVALLEAAAVATLAGKLPAEHTSVGSRIEIDHTAPSPVGAEVTARATVSAVDGHRVTFDVAAEMDGDLVARGSHVRFVVPRSRFPG